MRTVTQCSWPGCDRPTFAHRRCFGHTPMKEIPGYRDMYCQLCGFGPRVSLAQHVNLFHDGVVAYKRQFGHDSIISPHLRLALQDIYTDRKQDGTGIAKKRQRRTTCPLGHRLSGRNLITVTKTINGKTRITRACRTCTNAKHRENAAKRAARKPKLPKRKCVWCRGTFQPDRKIARFCCAEHRRSYVEKRRQARRRKPKLAKRRCDWCEVSFQPTKRTQRFCCPEHTRSWWNANAPSHQSTV